MLPADGAGSSARAARFATALDMVADRLMFDTTGRRRLRVHDSGIFLLPRANVVARLIGATNENRERAGLAVQVTDWLCRQGFPAIEPVHYMPYEASGVVMTFWRHLPQPPDQAPPPVLARALGSLLRELHALPAPPFQLPTLDPFARLRAAIEMDTQRSETVLSHVDHAFLVDRIADLRQAYAGLEFPRGHGLIHNDAHIGNLLASAERPYGYVLADWESARLGPREVDLVLEGAPGNRFGDSAELRQAFTDAYGYDVAAWDGWRVLRDARDVPSLAAYIRVAPNEPAAAHELRHRLATLRTGDRDSTWRVPAMRDGAQATEDEGGGVRVKRSGRQ